ncbi:hypothetical protein AMS66_25710 [Paenibacillus xylanivorans]|uniref:HTH cro/C1-type domain-containing protein n=1 Tax=Paenibacillus xylanivorans TaxID=1705561 RepID=A0A0N0C352_9BACL|nr:hypothetical protein AMS66_25710 [Paenibacillus xylanivorans]
MNDKKLRGALQRLQLKYGKSTTFVAYNIGISRKHLSKWLNNESCVVSDSLKTKLNKYIKGEM